MAGIKNQHVFLVDDERGVRQAISRILKRASLNVRQFGTGADCLEQLASQRCDLLIADLKMPEMDGIELLKRAKAMVPWVRVLIVTGYGDVPTAVAAIKAGADDFIEKPLDKADLVQRVEALLAKNGNNKHLAKPLTERERGVLALVLDGKSNREIATLLNRSTRTIEVHRANIMHKLGAKGLVDLVRRTIIMGSTLQGEGATMTTDCLIETSEAETPIPKQ